MWLKTGMVKIIKHPFSTSIHRKNLNLSVGTTNFIYKKSEKKSKT